MLKVTGIFSAVIALLLSGTASAVELRVLEWEGYISTFKTDFEQYAKSKGKDVTLVFPKRPDGTTRYITSADDIFTDLRNGATDIVTPTNNYYRGENAKLIQLLQPVDAAKLGNLGSVYPRLRDAAFFRNDDGSVYGVPLLGGSYALAYNAGKGVKSPNWADLLTPAAKGKFMVTSDQFEANVYQMALLSGVKPADIYDIDRYSEAQRTQVAAHLKTLVANSAGFWGGMPYPKDMKGLDYVTDYWFGVAAANKEGQNWRIAKSAEKVTVWMDTLAISRAVGKDPAKLDAAYLLLDYMISPDVQARIHKEFGSVAINAQAAKLLPPEMAAGLPGEDFFAEEYFWQPLTPRTRNAFKIMWDNAVKAAGK
ncbi:MAG: extracellular solute-binding protein [Magnetospirillum sp.]|nr:extracellular solute-binding protein [Magnetospirillum sp.]